MRYAPRIREATDDLDFRWNVADLPGDLPLTDIADPRIQGQGCCCGHLILGWGLCVSVFELYGFPVGRRLGAAGVSRFPGGGGGVAEAPPESRTSNVPIDRSVAAGGHGRRPETLKNAPPGGVVDSPPAATHQTTIPVT